MELVIHSDGGARGNPGPAGIGVVISDPSGKVIKGIGEYIGETTNNQAEYRALIKGLTESLEMGAKKVTCFLDSELVVKQLTGIYKIKEAGLQELAMDALKLKSKFQSVQFKHVKREQNVAADKLVNQALDIEANKKSA